MTALVPVPRLWPGSTVVCVASGPSLTAEDCAYIRGKARVIAVNDGIRFTRDFADVLYSSDVQFWRHYHGCPDFAGMKYAVGPGRGRSGVYARWPDITALANTGRSGIESQPHGLRTGQNSGAAAVNLAVHLGASRILLLGYNMGRVNGQAHFFGSHPSGLINTDDRHYRMFCQLFAEMVKPLQALGVEVINCTEGSALTCFPFQPLHEALPESAEVAA